LPDGGIGFADLAAPGAQSQFDYQTEKRSRYDLWWVFGWPMRPIAMGRLVFSGIFDRHPNLKIISIISARCCLLEGRAGSGLDQLGSRTEDADDAVALGRLRRRPLDYFRMFYGDTALFGALAATECGLAFFGADQLLFGTDMPFDPEKGPGFIRETIRCIDQMRASPEEKANIYEGNARRLLKLRLPG
jgi:aminocarboxymuconate-semialdehyde decarboxylase